MDWNNADPDKIAMLTEALLFAYPKSQNFKTFLRRVNYKYDQLKPDGYTYEDALPDVLERIQADGKLNTVVLKAYGHRKDNYQLKVLKATTETGIASLEVPSAFPGTLQDIVRNGGFSHLYLWAKKLLDVSERVCRIEYPINNAVGTGWLVGPDLVMTNWHVMRKAIGDPPEREPKEYVFRFDYKRTEEGTQRGFEVYLADDWLIASSPASPYELGTGQQKPTNDYLDFALMKLASSVGNKPGEFGDPRGYFTIDDNASIETGDILLIAQHPDGDPQKLAFGAALDPGFSTANSSAFRLFYDANTEEGTSGAPVLDDKLELRALHQAGDVAVVQADDGSSPTRNQGIPMSLVKADVNNQAPGSLV